MLNDRPVAIGRLSVRQMFPCTDLTFIKNEYDLALCAVSWESRCTQALSSLRKAIPKLYALRFETLDREPRERKASFTKKLSASCKDFEEVQLGRSFAYADNARKLDDFLAARTLEKKRPLRVLCDITCIPKSYLLVLLGMGFKKGYFARFDCIYSEGDYRQIGRAAPAEKIVGAELGPISEGKWDSLPVPFFEANSPIPKSRNLFVTLGGEIGLTVPFIEKYEPNRLEIILIENAAIGRAENLGELLNEPILTKQTAEVFDVLKIAQRAVEFCRHPDADVVTALAVGSKPHALGIGIAALKEPKMEIICRVPKRYTMRDIPASGAMVFCEIVDRFEPNAYLELS